MLRSVLPLLLGAVVSVGLQVLLAAFDLGHIPGLSFGWSKWYLLVVLRHSTGL